MNDDPFMQLAAPFPPDRVSWRVGSTNKDKTRGMALAYIDARDVMDRLDAVVGPAGWQCEYPHAEAKTVCRLAIKIGREWVWKADGAGDTDYEAEKGALSDAFKRAAVRWGIGRYLYDIPSPWVAVEQKGKSYVIVESELPRLHALLRREQPASTRPASQEEEATAPASDPEPPREVPNEIPPAFPENVTRLPQVSSGPPNETQEEGDFRRWVYRVAFNVASGIDWSMTVGAVTNLMLLPETQQALNRLSQEDRDAVRDYAKRRLVALGWPSKKAG